MRSRSCCCCELFLCHVMLLLSVVSARERGKKNVCGAVHKYRAMTGSYRYYIFFNIPSMRMYIVPERICKLHASSLQVPCKLAASSLHLRCIRVADFSALQMRCRRPRRNSWVLYQVHPRCRFFSNAVCVADKSDTRMQGTCRNLQAFGTAYIRSS